MSEIRDLLKSKTYENLTPSNYQSAASPNFIDVSTQANLEDGGKIASAWQKIHAPAYGAPIPGRIKITSQVSSDTTTKIAQPTEDTQQVNSLFGASATNAGGSDPVVFDLHLSNGTHSVIVLAGVSILPGATTNITLPSIPIVWDYDTYLQVVVTIGTYADLTTNIAYYSPVQ